MSITGRKIILSLARHLRRKYPVLRIQYRGSDALNTPWLTLEGHKQLLAIKLVAEETFRVLKYEFVPRKSKGTDSANLINGTSIAIIDILDPTGIAKIEEVIESTFELHYDKNNHQR